MADFLKSSYHVRKKTTYDSHHDDGHGRVFGHGHPWWRGEGRLLHFDREREPPCCPRDRVRNPVDIL